MSDDQQPEDLRPIPDGGLKDSMPGWLKRPPAWRSMPSAEERHERTLPEPDTSEIDPKSLVDVSDLPQWLQSIANRGEIPVPQPDETVGYALQQVQAASAQSRDVEIVAESVPVEESPAEPQPEEVEPDPVAEPEVESVEPKPTQPVTSPPAAESRALSMALIVSVIVIVLALAIGAYTLL